MLRAIERRREGGEGGIMVFVSCFVGGEIALNVTCHLAAQMEIQGSRQGKQRKGGRFA